MVSSLHRNPVLLMTSGKTCSYFAWVCHKQSWKILDCDFQFKHSARRIIFYHIYQLSLFKVISYKTHNFRRFTDSGLFFQYQYFCFTVVSTFLCSSEQPLHSYQPVRQWDKNSYFRLFCTHVSMIFVESPVRLKNIMSLRELCPSHTGRYNSPK